MPELTPEQQKRYDKALKLYSKAEKFIAKEKFDKAKESFKKAIKEFYSMEAYAQAQKIINKFVESALIEKEYFEAAVALYEAANIALIEDNVKKALENYKSAINFFVEQSGFSKKDQETKYKALCLSPLCEASIGKFEQAIEYFKTNLRQIPKRYRIKIPLIDFCTSIFNAIITKKIENLNSSKLVLKDLKLLEGETKLLENLISIIELYVKTKIESIINKEKIESGDSFSLNISLNSPEPIEILKYYVEYDTQRLELTNVPKIIKEKPLEFIFNAKVQGKAKFGPLLLNCKAKGVEFPFKYQGILNILPGRPKLEVNVESEMKLFEGDAFDFEFDITNQGKGEAINLTVNLEVPEEILIIAGTNEKRLYSLNSKESYSFTFPLQAIKAGTYGGKINISYEIPQDISKKPQKIEEEKKIVIEVN